MRSISSSFLAGKVVVGVCDAAAPHPEAFHAEEDQSFQNRRASNS